MEAKPKSQSPTSLKRLPELNVIYFVDASRTKSFRVSLPKARIMITSIVVAVLWALASVVLLWQRNVRITQLEDRLEVASESILGYQVRFESVYEQAYPEKGHASPIASADRVQPDTEHTELATSEMDRGKTVPSSTRDIAAAAKKQSTSPVFTDKVGTTSPLPFVRIEDVVIGADEAGLTLSMSLRNNHKSEKAEGYVYAIAQFIEDDGGQTHVSVPLNVGADAQGKARNPKAGYRFAIQYFKTQKFSIPVPLSKIGAFTQLSIGVYKNENELGLFHEHSVPPNVQKQVRDLSLDRGSEDAAAMDSTSTQIYSADAVPSPRAAGSSNPKDTGAKVSKSLPAGKEPVPQ